MMYRNIRRGSKKAYPARLRPLCTQFFFQLVMGAMLILNLQTCLDAADSKTNDLETVSNSKSLSRSGSTINTTDIKYSHCEAFYYQYMKHAGAFIHCELKHVRPFRLCLACIDEYFIASSTYKDLMNLPTLEECRLNYTRKDRVQIIPTVQENIENIWSVSDCSTCATDVHIDHVTGAVDYVVPDAIQVFQQKFLNISACMNISIETFDAEETQGLFSEEVESPVCWRCLEEYRDLNSHYKDIWSSADGNICMDMVDRVNYTRFLWSQTFNCSHRSGEPAPVIAITVVVGLFPLLFYLGSRITGQEIKQKLVKQKRFGDSSSRSGSSTHRQDGRSSCFP